MTKTVEMFRKQAVRRDGYRFVGEPHPAGTIRPVFHVEYFDRAVHIYEPLLAGYQKGILYFYHEGDARRAAASIGRTLHYSTRVEKHEVGMTMACGAYDRKGVILY